MRRAAEYYLRYLHTVQVLNLNVIIVSINANRSRNNFVGEKKDEEMQWLTTFFLAGANNIKDFFTEQANGEEGDIDPSSVLTADGVEALLYLAYYSMKVVRNYIIAELLCSRLEELISCFVYIVGDIVT